MACWTPKVIDILRQHHIILFKAKMRGSLATNIATAPAPCVGSPPEFNPYFAISAATTKTFYLDVRLRDS